MSYTPETHEQYAQRIGSPRVVPCQLDLGSGNWNQPVWWCYSHDFGFNVRAPALRGFSDRCPMSRLEEWRARRWAAAA